MGDLVAKSMPEEGACEERPGPEVVELEEEDQLEDEEFEETEIDDEESDEESAEEADGGHGPSPGVRPEEWEDWEDGDEDYDQFSLFG